MRLNLPNDGKDFTAAQPEPKDSPEHAINLLVDEFIKTAKNGPNLHSRQRVAMEKVRKDIEVWHQYAPADGTDHLILLYQDCLNATLHSGCVVFERPTALHEKIHTDLLGLLFQLRDMLDQKYAHVNIAHPLEALFSSEGDKK